MKKRFDIIRHRMWFFILSGTITVAGLVVFLTMGFNLGTDFVAGSRVQLTLNQTVNTSKVRQMLDAAQLSVGPNAITVAGTKRHTAVIRFSTVLTQSQLAKVQQLEKKTFHSTKYSSETVSPIVAQTTSKKAVWAVLLASLFIVVYVSIRFEYRFAVAAIVALLHDAFIVMSVFALLRLPIDLPFVAAVLTIVGYSVNDTIVIFDRIRENQGIAKPRTFGELERMVDKSLWQTMSRSINTVITVLIAAVMLYFFGGESIHDFTFALIVGLVSGAYSSIFIASPIWVVWKGKQMKDGRKDKLTPEQQTS
ncbi:protein translocase subunit SecF [Alicyclobacillus sp. SO9]|uniref:protein translocase subunit SecF n=1 Tax=Alicyclobacillus sp. SO9 TaxID=2665646 RepID=UPI0018E718B4|nr:protein translocase subunit SecF [Alicyclobacillus sp. SO9]QQE77452.1 protein translocase subunit SecF [Alicyclobacillus sp. SO9]